MPSAPLASWLRGTRPTVSAMLSSLHRPLRHLPLPRLATFLPRMLPLLLMHISNSNGGAQAFLVPPPTRLLVTAPFLSLPSFSDMGATRSASGEPRGVAARHRIPPLSMSTTSSSTTMDGPRGSRPGDSVTREGFLTGTTAIVVAGLAPGVLTEPSSPPSYDVTQERIFDTRKRSFVPAEPERLIVPGRVGFSQRIVCLGEMHTHPLHHRMQFNVIKAIHGVTESLGESLAIGLEMFYRQQQGPLDRYVFNHGDLQLLKMETKWDQTWGFDFNQYVKIFRYAREQGIRLVGLNAPQSLLYLINRVGMAGLPKRIKDVLPEMDLGREAHRRRFEDTINGFQHGERIDSEAMGRMYEAQTLWDEYMAETTSQYIKKAGGRIVLLAGNGHVQARDGIPDRVERRTGLKPFTVVPVSVGWTPEGLPDIEHPPGVAFADWVYFTQLEIGPPQRGAGSNQRAGSTQGAKR